MATSSSSAAGSLVPSLTATESRVRSSVGGYALSTRVGYFAFAVAIGACIAGFWNAGVVDGFGRDVVAANAIGGYAGKAAQFSTLGATFGFVFAIVAGLAATFTACNCVVFAMIPGLVFSREAGTSHNQALRSLGIMTVFVAGVDAIYGAFIGWLGPLGAAAFNTPQIRGAQSSVVFSTLGLFLLAWALVDLDVLRPIVERFSPVTRAFFSQQTTRAGIMGVMAGAFAIGRPYPVFREFLLFTAQSRSPAYGAAVMALQGVGQIFAMAALSLLLVVLFGRRFAKWLQGKPHRPALTSALALASGGAYFICYWGIFRAWPLLGRWGFRLGLYHR